MATSPSTRTALSGLDRGLTLQFVEGNRAAIDVFLQPAKREQLGPVTLRSACGRLATAGSSTDSRRPGDLLEGGREAAVFPGTDLARGNPAIGPERHLDARWLFVPVAAILLLMLYDPAVVVARRRHR